MQSPKSDEVFLAELEDFLTQVDMPALTSTETLHGRVGGKLALAAVELLEGEVLALSSADLEPLAFKNDARTLTQNNTKCVKKRASEPMKNRHKGNLYHKRQRSVHEQLREQVKELTQELSELQKSRQPSKKSTRSLWNLVVKWQRDRRLSAELQHRRLREVIDSQAAFLHKVQKSMLDRHGGLAVDNDLLLKNRSFHQLEISDVDIFAAYTQELDTIYAQTDEALRSCGLHSMHLNATMQAWKENIKTGSYLYTDKQVIPFDFKKTSKLLWQVAHMTHRQESRELLSDTKDGEGNTIAIKYRVTARLDSGRMVSVLHRVVARRYEEGDRMVVAWRSLTEGEGVFTGMHADETGWVVATPNSIASKNGAVLRTCMHKVPMHFQGVVTCKPEVKQFTHLILETGSTDVLEVSKELENLMLRHA